MAKRKKTINRKIKENKYIFYKNLIYISLSVIINFQYFMIIMQKEDYHLMKQYTVIQNTLQTEQHSAAKNSVKKCLTTIQTYFQETGKTEHVKC